MTFISFTCKENTWLRCVFQTQQVVPSLWQIVPDLLTLVPENSKEKECEELYNFLI